MPFGSNVRVVPVLTTSVTVSTPRGREVAKNRPTSRTRVSHRPALFGEPGSTRPSRPPRETDVTLSAQVDIKEMMRFAKLDARSPTGTRVAPAAYVGGDAHARREDVGAG
jgi:hypothetical protein